MKDIEQARMLLSMARKDMSALQGMSDSKIFDRDFDPCRTTHVLNFG